MRDRSLIERKKEMLDDSIRRDKLKKRGPYRIPDDRKIDLIDQNDVNMDRSDEDDEVYDEAQGYNRDYMGDTPKIYPDTINAQRRPVRVPREQDWMDQ
jgi:hypothetical protein